MDRRVSRNSRISTRGCEGGDTAGKPGQDGQGEVLLRGTASAVHAR
jgi:hypothetical protein